ncbi:MAG: biotin--[acetyl-CoA-carboxylase] ligase [Flavobacteriaceae bacterium]|nr:biotin--[acetyl-CoA-carboxylase] ligase [Flavobacteriaceae bacterium]|tara:strand:- start:20028 stop:20750 length:723 start_codon:yes stop_codon:yes gene_type:complete
MKLIKLNAIDSTNEYIKKNKDVFCQNELCVLTFNQTDGNGQRGNKWFSEPQKNICISFFFRDLNIKLNDQFKLNMLVSLKIVNIFKKFKINNLKIKWPNDILADKKKISGILTEFYLKNNKVRDVIIGFGININQYDFGDLKNATSFFLQKKVHGDLNLISNAIIDDFSDFKNEILNYKKSELKCEYLKLLHGLNKLIKFKINGNVQTAEIVDIKETGELVLEIEGIKKEFRNQEIVYIN